MNIETCFLFNMCATCYQLVLDLISETKSTNASTVKFNGQVVSTQLLTLYCLSDFLVIAINLIFIIYWMIYLLVSCRRKTERKTLSEHSNTKVDIENSIELEASSYKLRKVDSKRKPLLRRNSILDSIIGIGSLVIIVSHFCLIGEQLFIHNSLDKFLSVEPLCYVTSILTSIFLYRSVFNRFNYYLIERQSQTKSSQSRGTNLFVLVFHCYWLLQTGLAGHKFLLLTAIGSELTTHLRAQIYIVLILVYSTISMTLLITVYTNHKKKSNTIQSESIIWNRITYLHPFSSLLSRATYSWFFPLLKQGYQRPIQIDDLGDLPPDQWAENQFDRFCKVYEQERINSKNKSRPVSLWKCYWKTFKYSLFAGAILRLLADIFALFGPISIRYILDYVKEAKNVTQESVEEMDELHLIESHVFFRNGFVLSFMVLITTCLQSTFSNSFNHYSILEGIHLRSALQCLIYKKSLKMTVSLGMDVGSIVNHMSQDSFNMMMMFSMVHYIWALPLKIFVLLSLLYFQLGISSMIGAAVVYILLPIQYYLASRLSKIQTDQLELSDKRLKKTSELLMSMKLLKLLGWELLFADQIKTLRDQELKILKKDSIYVAIITFITQATSVVVTLVTFALYPYIEGQPLSASTVFSGLALFNQLTVPLYVIPFVIPIIVNSFVSTKRLSKFLLQPEIDSCVPWRMSSEAVSKGDEIRGTSHQSKPELNTNNVNALNLMKLPNNGQTDCHSEKQQSAPLSSDFEIQITSGYFSWTPVDNLSAACLKKIDLRIRRGQLTIITGPIGSGKSSLISAMLGELVTLKGTVQWSAENQEIAYLPQNPWLLNVSLRENVLFGSPFEPKRYKDVIEACALEADIEILPAKDRTEIGEKGVNLSGGQRQRIGLARALYSKARTLILDSPLSALDNQVGNHVFQRGIKEYCIQNKRTVIMISHKLEYIKEGGQIIVLEKGEIKRQGTYAEILVKDPNFSTELEKMKVNENKFGKLQAVEEGKTFKERQRLRRMFTKQSLYRTMSTKESVPRSRPVSFFRQVSHDLTCPLPCQEVDDYTDPCPASPDIVFDSVESDRRPGSPLRPNFLRMISSESSRSRVSSSSSSILRRSLRRLISKTSENAIAEEMEDNKSESGQMLDGQADEHEKDQLGAEFDPFFSDDLVNDGKLIVDEDRETGAISKKIYFSYIKACSPYWASLVIALISLTQAVKVATDFWLAKWTESNKRPESFLSLNKTLAVTNSTVIVAPNLTSNQVSSNDDDLHYYITGYVFLSIITIIISLVTNLLAQITSIRAARLLHGQMLDAVVRAPIRFFESTPIGRILNRFSNDVSTIDKKLPTTLPLLLRFLLLCFAAIVVDLIVSPVFLVVAFPIISVYYILQHFFRYTSRELQRLDSLTKSPILSHFSQTLSGLSTIRAFKAEKSFTDAIHVFINTNNLAFLMVNCSNCWLGIVLDYLGGLILFSATLFTVFGAVYGDISPSFVGMSITYTLLVPVYLNWVVRNLANLEMHLSAVERIDSYSKLEPEQYSDTAQPVQKMLDIPANWPSKGQIQFETVSLSYHLNRKPVLTSISFVVNPGEKIGICGRTGSGKSSLIMALFKMINVTEGVIYIDDIDLSMVCSNVLRQRLSLVPQDIVLFAGTIRENIDPTNKYSDDQLWSALETCELKSVFKSLEDEILEDGSNLSAGQRQLLCLARALVKQRSVLIMDEATSSLDLETERLVNKIISKRSETVLSIVHHMSTALDFDKVMVIQNGSIAEFGPPRDLMTTKGSLFSEMVKSQSDDITYT